ncbi:unnamed protein product [Phyllotreta striolata]|uniref:Sperm-associated antigen 1 n=1 Tax=Phyllotreta striolata TaxID=444603 RepID=A0A9N9TLB4_PHYSR|nr:unnamed protein product [Phyllotreta striolata]
MPLDDLSKLVDHSDPRNIPSTETLLSKYNIPITHFDFDYVKTCNDGRELEKMLQILRSGEEGYYPDLAKCTEDRLRVVKPKSKHLKEQVRVLRKNELNKEEVNEINSDLEHFVSDVNKKDKELDSRKCKKTFCDVEVRRCKTEIVEENNKVNDKRIAATDYSSWDKYDPDTELLKMDIEDEKEKKTALEEKEKKEKELKQLKEKSGKTKAKKSVTFNQFATEAEAIFHSEREREKGNEFFRAGDFEDALHCYSNSIRMKTSVNNLNNRAVTYLKLKKYEEALKDCNKVLTIDKENIKANIRKAEALKKLQRYEEAMDAIELAIQKDPNNPASQELADAIRKKCCREVQNTRMKIIEIEE